MRRLFLSIMTVFLVLPGATAAQSEGGDQDAAAPEAQRVRLSRLQGRAAVDRRTQVVGATVLIRQREDDRHLYLTSSGESGMFHFDGLPDGEYQVRVAREGLTPVAKDRIEVRFPFRAVVEVKMERSDVAIVSSAPTAAAAAGGDVSVSGTIAEREGGPLAEVRMRLVRVDGKDDPRSLRSEADGGFAFDGLPAGEWRLEVEGVGFLPMRQPLIFNGDTELSISMVRQPHDYEPGPLELMPPEIPLPPEGLTESRPGA